MGKHVRIDQSKDVDSATQTFTGGRIYYIYRRASESREHNAPGQDYIAFCANEKGLAFAVCDGVGQSFCGQLAAAFLAEKLIQESDKIYEYVLCGQNEVAEAMTAFLNRQVDEAQALVFNFELPASTPPLLQAALHESRRYGSETMFVYGFLEQVTASASEPTLPRLWLIWLGDTEAQVFTPEGERLDLAATWTTKERWSTVQGVKGTKKVHLWCAEADKIGRILVYSDGIAKIADKLITLVRKPEQLAQQIEQLSQAADSDDISLLDIDLSSAARVRLPEPASQPEDDGVLPLPPPPDPPAPAPTVPPQSWVEWEVVIVVFITLAIFVAIWLHGG